MNLDYIKEKIRVFNELNRNELLRLLAVAVNKQDLREILPHGTHEFRFYRMDVPRAELFMRGEEDPLHTHSITSMTLRSSEAIPRGRVQFLVEVP